MSNIQPSGPRVVLVGVDGSSGSVAAVTLAAQEARFRHVPLIAVQAYAGERLLEDSPASPANAESSLRSTVRAALGDEADQVQLRVVLGLAGRKIVEIAGQARAQLIVLAAHGCTSMLLGTVSQYVLRKAPCPVLIVPDGAPLARA